VPEVPGQRLPRDLRDRAGQLHTRWSAADDDERQQRAPPIRVRLALGALERQQHPPPHLQRIVQRLQPGCARPPLVVAEIGMRCAGSDDQDVVRHFAVRKHDVPPRGVDPPNVGEQHLDVFLPPQDPADRRRDIAGRQGGHRDLVEQRLKDVMVAAIEDRHVDRLPPERPGSIEPSEASPDDDDTGHGPTISRNGDCTLRLRGSGWQLTAANEESKWRR
jgi:hypothetical protein